jgi:hypothetical protein
MTSTASLVVGAIVGAGLATTVFLLRSDGTTAPSSPALAADATTAVQAQRTSDAAPLTDIAADLRSLHAAVRALDAKLDAALAARVPADGSGKTTTVTIDPTALQQAIVEAEAKAKRAKFDALKPGEAMYEAEQLINTRKDLGAAREMLEALQQRPLSADDRQKATQQLGIGHRASGGLSASKRALQQAIDIAGGVDTEAGGWAAFQLAWSHQFGDEPAVAPSLLKKNLVAPMRRTVGFPHGG